MGYRQLAILNHLDSATRLDPLQLERHLAGIGLAQDAIGPPGFGRVGRGRVRIRLPAVADHRQDRTVRSTMRSALGLGTTHVAVLFAARLESQKRPDLFAEAILPTVGGQLIDEFVRASVLPDDRVHHGLSRAAIP